MLKLSPRMQLIYDLLLPGQSVWDFCCDHGYMGLNAYESGVFPEICFVDQVPHIIEQLRQRFEKEYYRENYSSQAYFFPLPGELINKPLHGTAILAGVGAHTIFKILQCLQKNGFLHAQRIILCPQRDEEKLLEMLLEIPKFHYKLRNEDCQIIERGRSRKLLIFDKN